jgi:hypothetical protein
VNWALGLTGLALGCLLSYLLLIVYVDRIDWRLVSKALTFTTLPYAGFVVGASWGDFSKGLIASVAILFFLSIATDFKSGAGMWRSDENPPNEGA